MPPCLIAVDLGLIAVLPLLPATSSLLVLLCLSILGLVGAALRLRPAAMKTLARIVWRQKPGLFVLAVFFAAGTFCWQRISMGTPPVQSADTWKDVSWPMFRGSLSRSGHADSEPGPTTGSIQWTGGQGFQFYSSPTVAGNQILAIGSQRDTARLFCWDAKSGELLWTLAPRGLRATFSSAVIDENILACGEGLHRTTHSRVMCIQPRTQATADGICEFSTSSHVECTPVLANGRIFVNAGDDGVYCLRKTPSAKEQQLQMVWHAPGHLFPDAETALAVHEDRVYVGLGLGGEALCVLDANTGREIARLKMPYPVFSPPAISGGRIYVGMGRADYVTQEEGLPGEVRCIDLNSLETLWTITTPAPVLAAIVVHNEEIIFNCVNGQLCVADQQGTVKRQWNARAKVLTAPAVTDRVIYSIACDGMLTALDRHLQRIWSARLGAPGNYISSPVVVHGHVFVGTPDDGFLCVGDRPEGKDRNSESPTNQAGVAFAEPLPADVDVAWMLSGPTDDVSADVSASPAISAHEFVAPMTAAKWTGLVCGELRTGQRRRWIWRSAKRIEVSPVVSGNTVLCVVGEKPKRSELVALDRQTGRKLWGYGLGSVPDWLFADDTAVYVALDSSLYRFDLTGKLLWRVPIDTDELPIAIRAQMIAVCSAKSNQLFALDRMTGKRLWQADLLHGPKQAPVILDDHVFVTTAEGVEVRSLIDGSLRKSIKLGPTRHVVFMNQDRFVASTTHGELLSGSILGGKTLAKSEGLDPGAIPLVGTNAVVYSKVDHRMIWQSLDEAADRKIWFSPGAGRRHTAAPVFANGRAYVSISGQGLLCLESRLNEL